MAASVKPIPEGYHTVNSYLTVHDGRGAIEFYKKAFGAREMFLTLFLYVEDVDRTFNQAVTAGAKVVRPVEDMFWGDRYGEVKDPFGHAWGLASHKEDLNPEVLQERAKKAMAEMGQDIKTDRRGSK